MRARNLMKGCAFLLYDSENVGCVDKFLKRECFHSGCANHSDEPLKAKIVSVEMTGKVLWKYKVVGQDWKESLRVQKDGFVQMEFLTKFWRKNGAIFYKI